MRSNRLPLPVLIAAGTVFVCAVWLNLNANVARAAQPKPPFSPELLLNKITVAASNTPTQTTIISVTNPLTSAAGVAVTIYKGSEAGNQQACAPIVNTLDPNSSAVITLTETPCGAVDFFGEATINSDKVISATSTILRITTHYVALGGQCGSGVGRCYASPQAAADIAADGDSIKVAEGLYSSEAFQVLFVNRAITLTGGYTSSNWAAAYPITQPVVLDGRNNPGQRVVQVSATGAGTLTLEGLTIQRGNFDTGNGAGINILSGTVVLRDSQVLSNTAQDSAGISYLRGTGVPSIGPTHLTLENVTLRDNTIITGGHAAALTAQGANVVVSRSLVLSNRAAGGAAIDVRDGNFTLQTSTVSGTQGAGVATGAGLFTANDNVIAQNAGPGLLLSNSEAIITGNSITDNNAPDREGGGVAIASACVGTINLQGNTIRRNTARFGGGVGGRAFGLALSDNTIEDNRAVESGGGVQLAKDLVINSCPTSAPAISLSTNRVQKNSAPQAGALLIDAGVSVRATNDLVANNVTTGFQTASVHVLNGRLDALHWTLVNNGRYGFSTGNSASAGVTNTLIAGHSVAGVSGNISVDHALFFENGSTCTSGAICTNALNGDPKFFWPLLNDYHICQGSAAIDQGLDAGVNSDFEGQNRPQGGGFDIGADEWDEVNCRPIRITALPILLHP